MSKPFAAVFFFLFMVFVGYVVLGSTPLARIDRVCEPVSWAGRFAASLVTLIHPSGTPGVAGAFSAGQQNCRFVVWRQLYVDEFERLQQQMAAQAVATKDAPPKKDVFPPEKKAAPAATEETK